MESGIGGKLQGISLDAFLQMAQMEEITCTLSVTSGDRAGRLFLLDGKLIDAETDEYTQLEAAQQIISWEKSVIDITESCSKTVDTIKQPLMNILMEAMRIRDDAENSPPPKPQSTDKTDNKIVPPGTEKAAPSEKTPPEKSTATASKKSRGPDKPPDPDMKAAASIEKKPRAIGAGTASKSKGLSKRLPWKLLLTGLAVLLVAGGLITHFLSTAKQNRLAYEAFVKSVEESGTLERKLTLSDTYIRENPDSKHSEEVMQRIQTLMKKLDEKTFRAVEETASRLSADGALEEAVRAYEKYLAENKGSQYAGGASAALKTLALRIENRAFQEMKADADALGPERISLYRDFLKRYPDSDHREDVLALISAMEDEFFIYVESKIEEHEEGRNWADCIELGQLYLSIYPTSDHAEAVTKWLVRHRDEYHASQSFEQLHKQAEDFGTDHEAALAVFSEYLNTYPGTPAREKIKQEIERLTALLEQKRLGDAATRMLQELLPAGSRFSVENDETVRDTRTGLMWCLLDSRVTENRCLTYKEATAYVSSLETGGFGDWRLPSSEELKALYGKAPAFPFDEGIWYWSSNNKKRYIGQWIIDVQVVDPNSPELKDVLMKESWQCGAVRAVRRSK